MHAPRERRPPQPSWMRPITERLSPVINAVVFGFCALVETARVFAAEHLVVGPRLLLGEVWQPVTSLFVHLHPLGFFFNIIGLWFVGATLEQVLGRKRFLLVFFAPAIAANVAMVVTAAALGRPELFPMGCSLAIVALFVAFGKYYGKTPTRVLGGLVLEARVLAAVLVGFSLLADLMRFSVPSLVGDLVAVGLAYALSPGTAGGLFSGISRRRSKRHKLEVLEGGRRGERPRYLN
jgi:membrane associated rhomboid family serine protease